ncbi:sugar phosphate isomerase/epimerase family protein [candidate division KSB1 bacterium]
MIRNRIGRASAILILTIVMYGMFSCGQSLSKQEIVENWPVGTSVSRLHNYSEADFVQLKQAGFDCIEMGLSGLEIDPPTEQTFEQCRTIYENTEKAGLNLWSIHIPYGRRWDISDPDKTRNAEIVARITELLKICEFLKPEKLVIHASFEPVPDNEREDRFAACRDALVILAQEASSYNAQLVVECLPRTCLGNTGAETLALIKDIGGLGVCCDVNHMLQETPEEYIRNVGSTITTLHISDYDGEDERHWLPGEGIINWNNVIGNLVTAGYGGPFMFECRGTPEEKIECWEKLKNDYFTSLKQ